MLELQARHEISVARLVQLGRLQELHESHAACSGGPASVDQGVHLDCVSTCNLKISQAAPRERER